MFQLAVIGAGQLGSRHLQGLAKANFSAEIWVVDPSAESLSVAEVRYNDVKSDTKKVHFVQSYSDIKTATIDFAIIATGSKFRLEALKNLTQQCAVSNLVLEKILFPSLQEYDEASKIIREKNIKAWVNCPMRMNDFFRSVKEKIKGKFSLSVTGNSWGLACNGIHHFDYFAFIGGGTEFNLKDAVSNQLESKRKGYVEFEGSVSGFDDKGNYFEMTSIENGPVEVILTFHGEGVHYIIEDVFGNSFFKSAETAGEWKSEKFRVAFQSEMSGILAESILQSGTCLLTPYEESVKIHKAFLQPFLNYLQNSSKEKITICPIT